MNKEVETIDEPIFDERENIASPDEKNIKEKEPESDEQEILSTSGNQTEEHPLILLKIKDIDNTLEEKFTQLMSSFEKKLAYDATKQQQIDLLHKELQEYKTDLIAKTNRPLVNGLIYLYGNIGKVLEKLKSKPDDELTKEHFFKAINGVQEDIDILLNQNSVISFQEPDGKFEPKRQSSLKTIPTSLAEQVGMIATRVAPGFEQGEDIIQKESVTVYALDTNTNQQTMD